jgi:predicted Zn-dependent protease with MMP-like domain
VSRVAGTLPGVESPHPAGDAAQPAAPAPRRRLRRDRRGRGLRGRLVPPHVPLSRKPADEFDEIVLDVVEHLDARWRDELASVEFAVEDVPPPELLVDDRGDPAIPLARLVPGGPERDGSTRPPRIVVFRRPLEARARHPEDLADLVHDVVVDEVARHLGLDPDVVDPPGPPDS